MRRSAVVALVLVTIAFAFVGGPSLFTSPSTSDVLPEEDEGPDLVQFEGSESAFWAYLNARESFEKRSPINVVVRGETDEVVRLLTEEGETEWEELDEDHEDAEPGTYSFLADEGHHATGTEWGEAAGTTRYAFVDPGDGEGRWVTETLQLEDGDYYGHRMHIRLYEAPNSEDRWVAMQAHTEHFDWFTLRHRVDGVEAAQLSIERDFMSLPQVDNQSDVTRINLENAGPSDADGWATLVDLVGLLIAPALVGLTAGRRASTETSRAIDEHLTPVDRARIHAVTDRIEPRHLLLAAAILTLFLGVRVVGIALERHVETLSMHAIAALLYPVVALGIPLVTYAIATGLERRIDAAIVASLSLSLAVWLDYGIVGVDSLPIDVVLQRMLVVVALGLIAGGAARRATRESRFNDMLLAGTALWTLVLLATLFGYV
ncbi:hypothetical protein [Natronorarus salvus]|uniref:hypothetical protein n=1 Tax=Natronorarus salvus TaxID=3117733 RepID=UPI002F25F6F1